MRLLHYSDVENAHDDPERVGRFAGAVHAARDDETVVCDVGDTLAPGVLALATDGRVALDVLRQVRPDVATFGNHDFDVGVDALLSVVADSPATYVTANLETDGAVFGGEVGVDSWTTVTVGDERVGVFGLTDPRTLAEHGAVEDLTVAEPIPAARAAISELRAAGVDRVVCLSHLGDERALAEAIDVDAILGGHNHTAVLDAVDGTPIVRPGARAERIALVEVGDDGAHAAFRSVPEARVDGSVVAAIEDRMADHGLVETVARVDGDHGRSRDERFPESVVGNTVADAYRAAVDADVAVYNVGMLRAGPPFSGDVTVGTLQGVTPFDNEVWTAELDGEELRALFAALSGAHRTHSPNELFGHVSGATLTWTWTDEGSTLADATVGGAPLAADREYLVAAPTFLFTVDDWPGLTPDRATEHGIHQHDALVDYVREAGFSSVDGRMRVADGADPLSTHSLR